jgi:transposase InsO family protein
MYLTAIIDLHTRFVLNWHLSIEYELVYMSFVKEIENMVSKSPIYQ